MEHKSPFPSHHKLYIYVTSYPEPIYNLREKALLLLLSMCVCVVMEPEFLWKFLTFITVKYCCHRGHVAK